MVLDDSCSVPDVCASMDVGPTALRRWIGQVQSLCRYLCRSMGRSMG
ncbi:hypothetical protein THH46_14785 [Pseudomonas sp. NA13]|nr:hypothetical protein GFU70_13140 [Pseudomonas brassicacearum]